jgi:tRNA pseudouridine55 synthase
LATLSNKIVQMNGFLFIDKGKGCTSFDVIRALKKKLRVSFPGLKKNFKIGHCGTLDPIGTGLMIIALGEASKLLEFLLGADKVYRAECEFGAVSDTYDADGKVEKMAEAKPVLVDEIKKIVQRDFDGKISQLPPKFSAKKIGGKRACDLAREGKEVKLKPKEVEIYDFSFVSFEWPKMEFEVSCGSGTYVRSLVHDLGQSLGVGAYMTALRRLEIGFFDGGVNRGFSVDDALTVDEIDFEDESKGFLHTVEEVFAEYPSIELNENDFRRLSNGGFVLNTKSVQGGEVLAKCRGKVVGVLKAMGDKKFVKFRKQIKIAA